MELKDYVVSFIGLHDHKRHFIINEETLCGKKIQIKCYVEFNAGDKHNNQDLFLALLCKDCINKLPNNVVGEIKFKLIVMKLKEK